MHLSMKKKIVFEKFRYPRSHRHYIIFRWHMEIIGKYESFNDHHELAFDYSMNSKEL